MPMGRTERLLLNQQKWADGKITLLQYVTFLPLSIFCQRLSDWVCTDNGEQCHNAVLFSLINPIQQL